MCDIVHFCGVQLTLLQDAIVHVKEFALRIEGKLDNVQHDIQVNIFMSDFKL